MSRRRCCNALCRGTLRSDHFFASSRAMFAYEAIAAGLTRAPKLSATLSSVIARGCRLNLAWSPLDRATPACPISSVAHCSASSRTAIGAGGQPLVAFENASANKVNVKPGSCVVAATWSARKAAANATSGVLKASFSGLSQALIARGQAARSNRATVAQLSSAARKLLSACSWASEPPGWAIDNRVAAASPRLPEAWRRASSRASRRLAPASLVTFFLAARRAT
mmetsp:Transcript_7679/g.24539  ORF Transcript_7679/g.24539 Transcript_7679/m.24539 type:complete len:225 (+) Transcript_7679:2756-3430(+)